jgi:hypothetical protein
MSAFERFRAEITGPNFYELQNTMATMSIFSFFSDDLVVVEHAGDGDDVGGCARRCGNNHDRRSQLNHNS